MAEALVRIYDRSGNPLDSKAGDVISIQNDGWPWSFIERSFPAWVIIRVATNLTPSEIDAWLTPLIDPNTGVLIYRRDYTLDVSQLTIPQRNADGTLPIIQMTAQQLRKIVSKKP